MGLGILASIIMGGLAGWAASSIMGANTGIIVNIVLGIVGAVLANLLAGLVGISFSPTWISQGIAGLIGAVILIFVFRAFRR
ncbi:MAG: GlsB/YeaQ/YmgE family stress response membrane protein [Pseudomonadota bacterium]